MKKVVLNSDEYVNSQVVQSEPVESSSNEIVDKMRMSLLRLKTDYIDETGKKVDYESIRRSSEVGNCLRTYIIFT